LSRLFQDAHDLGHWTDAALGDLISDPAVRSRGALPHRVCSKATLIPPSLHHGLLSALSWRTRADEVYLHRGEEGRAYGEHSLSVPARHAERLLRLAAS